MFGVVRREVLQQHLSCPISAAAIAQCWQNWLCFGRFKGANDQLFPETFHANVS